MSSQERNQHALQRLVKYIAPRLYENEPPSTNSERALRALTGCLASNPPYVIDAFDLDVPGSAYIWDVAISPKGKVAIVVGIPEGETKCSNARLTIWPRPRGYSEFLHLGQVKDDATVRVLFPEGSDTPAVIVGGARIEWGDWSLELSMPDDLEVAADACLTLWEDSDHLRHMAYLREGEIVYEMNVVGAYSSPSATYVRWLGLVGGKLAIIQVVNGRDELHWQHIHAKMDADEQIVSESISVIGGNCLQFAAKGKSCTAHVAGHDSLTSSDPMYRCVWGDGNIFGLSPDEDTVNKILRLDHNGVFVPVAELAAALYMNIQHVFVHGEHFTVVKPDVHGVDILYSGHMGDLKVAPSYITRGPKTGFVRAHSGIIYQTMVTDTGGFIWAALDSAPGKRPLTKIFPLYGRFDQLVPIQDDHGRAIMGWGYAEGTFCVIRYPLPTR